MRKLMLTLRKQWQYHALLIPGIVLVFIFSYIPLYGLIIAFQRYSPALGFQSPWVGMANFEHLFNQPSFVDTIWNTLYIAIFKIIGGIIVPVTYSLLLNEVRRSLVKRTFQTIVYMPHFLSWVILAGIMIDILSKDGMVNDFLSLFNINPIFFLGDARIFPWTMIISDIWKSYGFGTVVYLAAIASIDPSLYESAIVDGATRLQQTWYITLPMMMPIIVLMTILSLGGVLNAGFDQIYNLYSPIVFSTGDIIDTFVFRVGIEQAQFSLATAVGMFRSLVAAIMIFASYYLAGRLTGYRVF